MLFAKALKSHKIDDLLAGLGAAGGAPAAGAPAAGGAAAAEEPAAEEKVEEEADVDMGGLFGDEEEDY